MNELFSIAGKVAVITGAGGVLGGNIAQHFVQQGAKVVAIDIRQEQLDNRVTELKQYGDDVIGIIVLSFVFTIKATPLSVESSVLTCVPLSRV